MTEENPLRPATETNVLLGQLMAKVDNVAEEQRSGRAEVSALRGELSVVKSDVAVLKSQQLPRTPWWSIASGLASIAAVVVVVINLLTP